MRCYGCGRLLGNNSPMLCPCWRSVKEGARLPIRIAGLQKRIVSILVGLSEAESQAERQAFAARAQNMNLMLRGMV